MDSYSVNFKNYTTHVLQVNPQFQYLERVECIPQERSSFDVFPSSWFLFISETNDNLIRIQFPEDEKLFQSPIAIFLPSKHIIHWKLSPGIIRWTAFRGEIELPTKLRNNGFVIPWSAESYFQSDIELLKHIENQKTYLAILPTEFNNSKLALKLKHHIDENYLTGRKIKDFCEELEMNYSSLTHLFKKCYRVNPNEYLNRLKLNAAVKELSMKDKPLIDACYESGFEEYSNFFRQFKSWLGVNPKHIIAHKKQVMKPND